MLLKISTCKVYFLLNQEQILVIHNFLLACVFVIIFQIALKQAIIQMSLHVVMATAGA